MAGSVVVLLLIVRLYISGTVGEEVVFRSIQGCEENHKSPADVNVTSLVMTSFDCVRECGRLEWCASVNVCPSAEPELLTCEKMTFTSNWSCKSLTPEPDCSFIEENVTTCFNGGTYVKENSTCLCIFGFTGDWCERYYYDCSEAYQKTLVDRGTQWLTIHPQTSPRPFSVFCYLAWGGYTYIESRNDGCEVLSFNRTWEELKQPIINSDCSFWLGLENIHYLTSQTDYLLDIYMGGPGNFRGHPLYHDFRVGDEASGYRMSYGAYSVHHEPADDAFATEGADAPNGHPFATMDRPDAGGCTVSENAAWWYGPACGKYNLHRPFGADSLMWLTNGNVFDITSYALQLTTTW